MSDDFHGVHWMLATPFDEKEELDTDSIPGLVEKAREAGCKGVVALGMMGEAHRLTDREARLVAETVVEAADGMPVTLGTSAPSTMAAIARSKEAQDLGATAVMIASPPMARSNLDAVYAHYHRIAEAVDLPIIVQDYPKITGVHMPPEFFARLAEGIPSVQYCKIEAPPTPPKISAILQLTGDRLTVFGGLGGLFLLDELVHGAAGAMTGFAYPEVLVEICRHMDEGDRARAEEVFYRYLPLILFEVQEGIDLGIRKAALCHRGLISTPRVRHPGAQASESIVKELLSHIERLAL